MHSKTHSPVVYEVVAGELSLRDAGGTKINLSKGQVTQQDNHGQATQLATPIQKGVGRAPNWDHKQTHVTWAAQGM